MWAPHRCQLCGSCCCLDAAVRCRNDCLDPFRIVFAVQAFIFFSVLQVLCVLMPGHPAPMNWRTLFCLCIFASLPFSFHWHPQGSKNCLGQVSSLPGCSSPTSKSCHGCFSWSKTLPALVVLLLKVCLQSGQSLCPVVPRIALCILSLFAFLKNYPEIHVHGMAARGWWNWFKTWAYLPR